MLPLLGLLLSGLLFFGCTVPEKSEKPAEQLPIPFIISDPVRAKHISQFLLQLGSSSITERERAVAYLKQVNLPSYISVLLTDMGNSDKRISAVARQSLVREGKTIQSLSKFETNSLAQWNNAKEELVKLGPEALTAMAQVLSYKFLSDNEEHHKWAREQIRSSGELILKPLQRVLDHTKNAEIIAQLTLALAEMGQTGEELVNQIIKSTSSLQSLALVSALGDSGLEYWFDKLSDLLVNDTRWQVRAEAALALGVLIDPRAPPLLIKGLNDRDDFVKENCVKSLGNLKEKDALPYLIKLLDTKDAPRLIETIIVALTQVTGKRLGGKPDAWKKWWQENKQNYK